MHYEINVAKNGRHYFATHARSLSDESSARIVFADIIKRFPKSEGFDVSISRDEEVGRDVTKEFKKKVKKQ